MIYKISQTIFRISEYGCHKDEVIMIGGTSQVPLSWNGHQIVKRISSTQIHHPHLTSMLEDLPHPSFGHLSVIIDDEIFTFAWEILKINSFLTSTVYSYGLGNQKITYLPCFPYYEKSMAYMRSRASLRFPWPLVTKRVTDLAHNCSMLADFILGPRFFRQMQLYFSTTDSIYLYITCFRIV